MDEQKTKFGWGDQLGCVPVKPGCYHVSRLYAYDCFGSELLYDQDLTGHVRDNSFCLEAGKAYYLGDFQTCFEHSQVLFVHTYTHTLTIPNDNFEQ